jgi:hypothetical protein
MDDRGVVAAPRDRLESDARTPAHSGQAVRTPKAARKQLRLIKNFARSASTRINRDQAQGSTPQRKSGSFAGLGRLAAETSWKLILQVTLPLYEIRSYYPQTLR